MSFWCRLGLHDWEEAARPVEWPDDPGDAVYLAVKLSFTPVRNICVRCKKAGFFMPQSDGGWDGTDNA